MPSDDLSANDQLLVWLHFDCYEKSTYCSIQYQSIARNPEAHNRPGFKDVYTLLSSHESDVLVVPNEALLSHPQAGHLGAPLEAGEGLYLDLQKIYT